MDSQVIANFFDRAWRFEDLWLLRGETYGLRMEEAILLRIWMSKLGGKVIVIRLSSHVGFIPNSMADAVADQLRHYLTLAGRTFSSDPSRSRNGPS